MTTEITPTKDEGKKVKMTMQGGSSDTVYGLGLLGAWYFYISRATTLREGVIGFFKGLFWPAFLVYEVLTFLNKE